MTQVSLFGPVPWPRTVTGSAVFSPDGRYRYRLDRDWDVHKGRVVWAMLNPSTAGADVNDRTVGRCLTFTEDWGYGALTVINPFALVSTKPQALVTARDPFGPDNPFHIVDALSECALLVAAWGASVPKARAQYVAEFAAKLRAHRPLWVLGLTKDGHPRHPLYVASYTTPTRWLDQ
jgi:hypothetical protein